MTVQNRALHMVHGLDPIREILDDPEVKRDLEDFEPAGRDILAIVYERPEKTKSGILLPEKSSAREEDKFQGIVALVVKVGPCAEEAAANFVGGKVPEIGQWIIAPIASCLSLLIGKRTARLIEAQMVRGIVKRPDMVA